MRKNLFCKTFVIIILLILNCSFIQGQNMAMCLSDSVYCYLTFNNEKVKEKDKPVHGKGRKLFSLLLFIDNKSSDTIRISDYNRYVFHRGDCIKNETAFRWDLLTVTNRSPENVNVFLPYGGGAGSRMSAIISILSCLLKAYTGQK